LYSPAMQKMIVLADIKQEAAFDGDYYIGNFYHEHNDYYSEFTDNMVINNTMQPGYYIAQFGTGQFTLCESRGIWILEIEDLFLRTVQVAQAVIRFNGNVLNCSISL